MHKQFSAIHYNTFFQMTTTRHHTESEFGHTSSYIFINNDYTSPCGIRLLLYVTLRNLASAIRQYARIKAEVRNYARLQITHLRYYAGYKS